MSLMAPNTPPNKDRTDHRTAVTVAEAARILGLTPDAVRMRLKRGALAGEKRGAEWIVHLPSSEAGAEQTTEHHRTGTEQPSEQTTERTGPPWAALVAAKDETISHLAAENDYLRAELAARSRELADERERSDVLHREAFARIEALTAGPSSMLDSDQAPEPNDDPDHPAAADRLNEAMKTPESPYDAQDGSGRTEAASLSDDSSSGVSDGPHGSFARWWARIFGR